MSDHTRASAEGHDGGDPRVTRAPRSPETQRAQRAANAAGSGDVETLLDIAASLYAEAHPGLITQLDLYAPGVQSSDIAPVLDAFHSAVSRHVRRMSRIV